MEISRLALQRKFDYILIESTGISEPLPVALTFSFEAPSGVSLSEVARLDTCVTVVDCFNFWSNWYDADKLAARAEGGKKPAADDPTVLDLMVNQLEFANVIMLNKIDLVDAATLAKIRALVSQLNPGAKILETHRSQVALDEILNTKLFDIDAAEKTDAWQEKAKEEQFPEALEYSIGTLVFRADRPFHPGRLHALITGMNKPVQTRDVFRNVLRSKGIMWIATRPNVAGQWAQAGSHTELVPRQPWWVATPREQWPESPADIAEIVKHWNPKYGDSRNELMVIGCGWKRADVEASLHAALLTDEEFEGGQAAWDEFDDPLPPWPVGDAHHAAPGRGDDDEDDNDDDDEEADDDDDEEADDDDDEEADDDDDEADDEDNDGDEAAGASHGNGPAKRLRKEDDEDSA